MEKFYERDYETGALVNKGWPRYVEGILTDQESPASAAALPRPSAGSLSFPTEARRSNREVGMAGDDSSAGRAGARGG